MLQAGRSRVRDPIRGINFLNLPNPSSRTRPCGLLSLSEMSTRNKKQNEIIFLGSRASRCLHGLLRGQFYLLFCGKLDEGRIPYRSQNISEDICCMLLRGQEPRCVELVESSSELPCRFIDCVCSEWAGASCQLAVTVTWQSSWHV
jgi:hypothetical protein